MPSPRQPYVVTCIGSPLLFSAISEIVNRLTLEGFHLHRMPSLSEGVCLEMVVSALSPKTVPHLIDPRSLTHKLAAALSPWRVDIVVQPQALYRRKKRLLVMDMDSTLVQMEGIDELAKEAGVGQQVAQITYRAMNGEIAFGEALRERVRLLKGLPVEAMHRVYKRTVITPGAEKLIAVVKKLGCKVAVLSGGFDYFVSRVQKKLGIDHSLFHVLQIKNGKLTGEIVGGIVDGEVKLRQMKVIMQREGIQRDEVIVIGDGANDLPMITHAGLGIAFNAKPRVRELAPCHLTRIDTALYLLGLSEAQIVRMTG